MQVIVALEDNGKVLAAITAVILSITCAIYSCAKSHTCIRSQAHAPLIRTIAEARHGKLVTHEGTEIKDGKTVDKSTLHLSTALPAGVADQHIEE